MADPLPSNERFTGQHATLKWSPPAEDSGLGPEYSIDVSNVSWSRDAGTTDVQHNNGLKATKAITDIRFSGSFEYNGQNPGMLNALMYANSSADANGSYESSQPVRGTLTVKEQHPENEDVTYVYTFKRCIVTSQSRDVPSDDVGSMSIDWEAEDMVLSKDGDDLPHPSSQLDT